MLKIMSVVGARPNFMKIAPFSRVLAEHGDAFEHILVHTGQHYDARMSARFFDELDIPRPDIDLGIGSGTHAEQVGRTMMAFETVLRDHAPDLVVVVGDVNATCACSITAKKEHVKLAHVEAGLRSFDLNMPEEINRMVTDRLSDLLFTTDEIASSNLRNEGASEDRIRMVGNIMIDTLTEHLGRAEQLDLNKILLANRLQQSESRTLPLLEPDDFALLTMHRPSNVDDADTLAGLTNFLLDCVAADMPLVWPIHPRARNQLIAFGLWEEVQAAQNLVLLSPVGYHEMLALNQRARIMLTDSGGLQEECCVLGTPCVTLRWNTERPVTLVEHQGVSILAGNDVGEVRAAYQQLKTTPRRPHRPALWDGHTAERIVEALLEVA